jgi:hypothetical protein
MVRAVLRQGATMISDDVQYRNRADKGGHVAAGEQPALFASELRAAFKPLR